MCDIWLWLVIGLRLTVLRRMAHRADYGPTESEDSGNPFRKAPLSEVPIVTYYEEKER